MRDAKRRSIIFITIAILLAVVAGVLFMNQVNEVNDQLGDMETIYVADHSITSREPLSKEDFTTRKIPKKFLTSGAVQTMDNIEQFIAMAPISEGEQLNESVLKPGTPQGLTSEDSRVVTLTHSDRVMFDGSFEANDLVDIVVSYEEEGDDQDEKTSIFLEDVKVTGVNAGEEGIKAIRVGVHLETARKLIHEITFAHSIRILEASQAQSAESDEEDDEGEENEEDEDKEDDENEEEEDEEKDDDD